jgi:hypothetical protein
VKKSTVLVIYLLAIFIVSAYYADYEEDKTMQVREVWVGVAVS